MGACADAAGETLATVDGVAITAADVEASFGDDAPKLSLREKVEALVTRQLLLARARQEGFTATKEDVNRAYELAYKAFGPNTATTSSYFKKRLGEEIIIGEYIRARIWPTLDMSEERLTTYFSDNIPRYEKNPPRDKAQRLALFEKHRWEVAHDCALAQIERALREQTEEARKRAIITWNIP